MPEKKNTTRKRSSVTVAAVTNALDMLAPFRLAADWDNVGLLSGRPEWEAPRWLAALDLTDAVAREALDRGVNGLVLYHPPIFKGLKRITPDADGPTSLLPDLAAARVALLATHTALDAAEGGTNDLLLDAFDVPSREPLDCDVGEADDCKLVVFVPESRTDALRAALSAAGAGVIGAYRDCSYELRGRGTFRGDESTRPTIGEKLRLETVEEVRLELVAPRNRLGEIVRALYAAHSYEEPAFDLYPLRRISGRGRTGLGRVGLLRRPTRGTKLLHQLRNVVDDSTAVAVGDLGRAFRRVVAAAGSFGVDRFTDVETLYVTGEFKHHEALKLLRRGVTAVALGHYASERPVLDYLCRNLSAAMPGLRIEAARSCRAPLTRPKQR